MLAYCHCLLSSPGQDIWDIPCTVRTWVSRQIAAAEARAFLLIVPSFSIIFSFLGVKLMRDVFCVLG